MSTVVSVLVADLRREPVLATLGYERDFLQETQLLYGEPVIVHEIDGPWSYVEALLQPQGEKGYFGWMRTELLGRCDRVFNFVIQEHLSPIYQQPCEDSAVHCILPFGACCFVEEYSPVWLRVFLCNGEKGFLKKAPSQSFFNKAEQFLNFPYLWGGCSPYLPLENTLNTSVDCSGLVHLLYRSIGIRVPRNAGDQKKAAVVVEALVPGDLVFRASSSTPTKIDHVMIYEKDEILVEACLEAGCVRRISFRDKFEVHLADVSHGQFFKNDVLFFGRPSFT